MRQYFDANYTIVEVHEALQAAAGNATWLNEFFPVVEGPKNAMPEYCFGCFTTWVVLYNRW